MSSVSHVNQFKLVVSCGFTCVLQNLDELSPLAVCDSLKGC